MRPLLPLLIAALLVGGAAGCGSKSSNSSGAVNPQSEASPTPQSGSGTSAHGGKHRRHRKTGSGYAGTLPGAAPAPNSVFLSPRTKTSGCRAHGGLPDPACTPGATFSGVTAQQICVLGYSRKVRNVTSSVKRRAYAEYGITSHAPGQYEVDHLVSLELGGSNSIANLWPEPAEPTPGFHQKDEVENYLHAQVCSGKTSLQAAQRDIATNWLTIYHRNLGH